MTATMATRSRRNRVVNLWTPPLATCSYRDYRRGMGTPVRIAPEPPRTRLPDPRWTDATAWPKARFLIPSAFSHKGLTPEERAASYLRDLNRLTPGTIANGLRDIPVEDGRLVLLCFERSRDVLRDPFVCHRRLFAEYWRNVTGVEVPELVP